MSHVLSLPVDYVPSHATNTLFSSLRQRRPPTDNDWPHNEFDFEPFVKRELQVRLDSADDLCPRFAAKGQCDWGSRCTLRHCITPSPSIPTTKTRDVSRRTVCKHWLRGLCKKGDQCDYLHEYDLRRMPECRFYATFGFCNSADECLYIHIDPSVKRRACERYERGFCELGPHCPKKHIRKMACPYYLAGFCPLGPECNLGHIKALYPSPASRAATPLLTHRPLTMAEAFDWAAAAELRKATAAAIRDGSARKRELADVQCYKCGEYNHFANACPNSRMGGGFRGGGGSGFDRSGDRWR
ncbi:cleavage and polyadenylation specificity factor [Malassezia pachydermatis]|uniref:mRNA 3'-end-processing protein n=1 Tax=Malassezia pachydermatis TaxID=77020 RepID=A0A0M8MUP0_9BASI|nr:cleavage and polyadenylation specificity factor [Malassezia pachydermatis]KOS14140.1 cleavage and polyadenylation specificity factor [Malassezia pachydermatis]